MANLSKTPSKKPAAVSARSEFAAPEGMESKKQMAAERKAGFSNFSPPGEIKPKKKK